MRSIARVVLLVLCAALASQAGAREYLKAERSQQRGFSNAVIVQGGKTVYIAGQTAVADEDGKSLAGDFVGQARAIFRSMDRILKQAGGSVQNLVTITVYLTDPRYIDPLMPVRREFFPDGNFPASTTITISNLPAPGMLLEITGTAVIGDQ